MYTTTTSEEFQNKFSKSLEGPNNHTILSKQSSSVHNTDPNLLRTSQLFQSTVSCKEVNVYRGTGGGFKSNNNCFIPTDNDIPVQPVARWRDRLIDPSYHPSDLTMTQSSFNKHSSLIKEKEHAQTLIQTLQSAAGVNHSPNDDPLLSSHPTGYKSNYKSKNIVSGCTYPDHLELTTSQHVSETKDHFKYSDPYQYSQFMSTLKN
ncbi:hypothetical protein C9374_011874 [Naegleria lovaniensis]|uniref:Uncharacterized protein n=1 Tax=Naegleria lovaniensis TaxID=51637 RepID=A0AA88G935_NAELO|nr:uncharacterized protein C9374_011874 [Naegleria lovaniensis]KAG2373785.1 hypothetical protein C9374_011874 [Naegleria lovaniensis]